MTDRALNPDVASALASIKSILAIVNGLTLTNTLLVLITAGRYSHITPLGRLSITNVAFAVVLVANIVRFYHGNVRHLDSAYGTESVARAASGRHAAPRTGLGVDFFVIFTQSLLFSVASFYVSAHSSYISLFIVLLGIDILWAVYSQQADESLASPQRMWLLNNLVAVAVLIVFYLVHKSHPSHEWTLDVALAALAATTIVDYVQNWAFYFPATKLAARP